MPLTIVVLEGDQTGQELLEQSLRVIDPGVTGVEVELERFDLSLESRRATDNAVCEQAAKAMVEAGLGIKAATITPEGADDVGSPNRLIREGIDGKVIVRTGRRIPGVTPLGGIHHPISVVRMAVEDAYGAEQWRADDDGDEAAYRTEVIHRSICKAVAEYAFRAAEKIGGKVYGGPKWTVSPVYEGMLKEEMDAAAERHPAVAYEPLLIDATYAGLISGRADTPLVIPALNRDGDLLSDLVLPLFGSIAGAESMLLALDDELDPRRRHGRGSSRDSSGPRGQGRGEPDGDDPRRGRPARRCGRARRRGRRTGRGRDLRCRDGGGRRRHTHSRPQGSRRDHGVHGRGDRARAGEARLTRRRGPNAPRSASAPAPAQSGPTPRRAPTPTPAGRNPSPDE